MIDVTKRQGSVAMFLRLWMVLLVSYAIVQFAFNLLFFGWIDLRTAAWQELLAVPFGQSVVYWMITRRGRAARAPA